MRYHLAPTSICIKYSLYVNYLFLLNIISSVIVFFCYKNNNNNNNKKKNKIKKKKKEKKKKEEEEVPFDSAVHKVRPRQ
jgi:large-conductance mechanosensitive channel